MNKKNWMSEIVKPVNPTTIQDLPPELAELSEEDLQLVVGGIVDCCCGGNGGNGGHGGDGGNGGNGGHGGNGGNGGTTIVVISLSQSSLTN